MVSPTFNPHSSAGPTPLAWKEFRRRSGLKPQPKVYVYDASPQIVPNSPNALSLSPILSCIAIGQESPRKDHPGYLVAHVTQALQTLGSSTGGNIADYIAENFSTEQGLPYEKGRKLHYMVNAILSSPKYKYLFLKDQVLKDEKRSSWRLKQPGDVEEDLTAASPSLNISLASLIPPTASLSSLIPASPSLTLSENTNATPDIVPHSLDVPSTIKKEEEDRDDKKLTIIAKTTEHPSPPPLTSHSSSSSSASFVTVSPSVPSPSSPNTAEPSSPPIDTPPAPDAPLSLSLSSRRKKRKGSVAGLDLSSSSSSVEAGGISLKQAEEEDKKRRLDVAA